MGKLRSVPAYPASYLFVSFLREDPLITIKSEFSRVVYDKSIQGTTCQQRLVSIFRGEIEE